ncbi:MAG: hypothetical protein NE334_03795 [Lentisphaeraceae bacterium]|nr:hypothetical protein [Lentisphaeraceae bacterium]
MKSFLYIFIFVFGFQVQAEIITYDDDYLRFSMPEDWVKSPAEKHGMSHFFNWDDKSQKIFVQVHRNKKWAQWHMKSLSPKNFSSEWKRIPALTMDNEPLEISYDDKNYILTILWKEKTGPYLLSKMKLTSFGCVAFHRSFERESEKTAINSSLDDISRSLVIPEEYEFIPEDLASELINNMGGAVVFIVLSLLYFMFSLFQRSQLHQRRIEMATPRCLSERGQTSS